MKKSFSLILFMGIFLAVIIFSNNLVSSMVCCEKLKNSGDGGWCRVAEGESECDQNYIYTNTETCQEVPECHGTCVNSNEGKCAENYDKSKCENIAKGTWYEQPADEIPQCQEVCCVIGDEAYFMNPTECKALFNDIDANGTILTNIKSRTECEEFQTALAKGACVVESPTERTCVMSTNFYCVDKNKGELLKKLKYPYPENEVNLEFHANKLCSAGELETNCGKSEDTICKDNKVYYIDTCGNTANVYDSKKYETPKDDYWTNLYNPSDASKVCQVDEKGSIECGNCAPGGSGTTCQDFNDAGMSAPQNNKDGLVCADLSCPNAFDKDGDGDKDSARHGESWCAGNSGALVPILKNLSNEEILDSSRNKLENYDDYNIPGTRYYRQSCSFGEIKIEECGDYRNEICTQGIQDDGKSRASCDANKWRACNLMESKDACEDTNLLCKWIPGYRLSDFELVSEAERDEIQGSCVPLVAPGYDFWNPTSQGTTLCAQATIQDYALFETSWRNKRDKFADWSSKTHAEQCVNGCYTIPDYGVEFGVGKPFSLDDLKNFYDLGSSFSGDMESVHVSLRKGQYCHKSGKPTKWLTGKIKDTNNGPDCISDSDKRRDLPVYITNEEWTDALTERARSLGDCGYKKNLAGKTSEKNSEIIRAVFEKLSQKGEVKSTIGVEEVIFEAGSYVNKSYPASELPIEQKYYKCQDIDGASCIVPQNSENPCDGGGLQEGDGMCPGKQICCLFEDLE